MSLSGKEQGVRQKTVSYNKNVIMGTTTPLILVVLWIVFFGSLYGCSHTNPNGYEIPSETSSGILPWVEYEGRFYTKDLERAQQEIPFSLLLPAYLPETGNGPYSPDINGPLRQTQNPNIMVEIKYDLGGESKTLKIVIIKEANVSYSLPDPALNPQLEQIEILGVSVVKTREDWSPDTDVYYSFNFEGIYYFIETHNLPNIEVYTMVESMIGQLI